MADVTVGELIFDTTITLPVIAEVTEDCCDGQQQFKKGDLLWLLQFVEDEEGAITSIDGSRWDAPDFTISFSFKSRITLLLKPYASVQGNISFGPILDVSGLAILTKDHAEPVFGLATDNEGVAAVLDVLAQETRRVVVHGRQHITGFLAQGLHNPLMIPDDLKNLFVKANTIGTRTVGKQSSIAQLLEQTTLPVAVIYSGKPTADRRGAAKSPDELTLIKESPITILAHCRYTATHFSLHDDNPSQPPCQATWLYPDYCKLKVRPASPIPLHSWALNNIPKPLQTVHILADGEFQEMKDRLEKTSAPPIPQRGPSATRNTPLGGDDTEPIYDVPPDARLRPSSMAPFVNRHDQKGGTEPDGTDHVIYDVPPRRSIKRNRRMHGRRAVSDLQLTALSRKEYVKIGLNQPTRGPESDGYMKMVPLEKPVELPNVPPRIAARRSSTPGESAASRNKTDIKPPTRKPVPAPRPGPKASTLPRPTPKPTLRRHAADSVLMGRLDDELDYGQDYELITEQEDHEDSNDGWGKSKTLPAKIKDGSGVDYGGHYAEAYGDRPSPSWVQDTQDASAGYLKPRKDL